MIKFELHIYHTSLIAALGTHVHLSSHTWRTGSANDISEIHQITINVFQSLPAGRFFPFSTGICVEAMKRKLSREVHQLSGGVLQSEKHLRHLCTPMYVCWLLVSVRTMRYTLQKAEEYTIYNVHCSEGVACTAMRLIISLVLLCLVGEITCPALDSCIQTP